MTTSLEIMTSHAKPKYVYDPAWTTTSEQGHLKEIHPGYRIKFEKLGMYLTREGNKVQGVYADGLAFGGKNRAFRALGKVSLEEEAERMRERGYEVTARDLLDWFVKKHGDQRGVTWNVYDENGQPLTEEALENVLTGKVSASEQKFAAESSGADSGDAGLIEKIGNNQYRCHACQKTVPGNGIAGHRRSKAHFANVQARSAGN